MMNNMRRFTFAVFLLSLSCSQGGPHKPFANSSPTANGPLVDYAKARPIFAQYCSACHPARSKPDWLDYQQAKEFAQNGMLLWRVWQQRSMPPPGSAQASSITDTARSLLAQWAHDGAPETAAAGASAPTLPTTTHESAGEPPPALLQNCLQCHGTNLGETSAHPTVPILVGQNAPYMQRQLQNFKWRERLDPTNQMNEMAGPLTAQEIQQVADYYANMPPLQAELREGLHTNQLYLQGKEFALNLCGNCHIDPDLNGRPSSKLLPVLASQPRQYLINQLIYFRSGERHSPLMQEFAKTLRNDDIAALAEYYSLTPASTEQKPTGVSSPMLWSCHRTRPSAGTCSPQ